MSYSRKKKIIVLSTILIIFTIVNTSTAQINSFSSSTNNQPFLLTKYTPEDTMMVKSDTIIDGENRTHLFLQIIYTNSTFVILHIVEDEFIVVERSIFSGDFFKAYLFENNVSLVYNIISQLYRNVVKIYNWNEETGHSISVLFTSNEAYIYPKIFVEGDIIHLLITEFFWGDPGQLEIRHIRIYGNGTSNEKYYYYDDNDFVDEYDVFVIDNKLFAFIKSYIYNETYGYYENTILRIVGITDNGYYNSTTYEVDDSWFSVQVEVGFDKKFYLAYVSNGILFTTKFAINETITDESFKQLNFGSYYFYEQFIMFSYSNVTYLVYPEQIYYWLEYAPYYYDPYRKTRTLELKIITDDGTNLEQKGILLEDFPVEYQFVSSSFHILENGSYAILYSTIQESDNFINMRFLDDYVLGWKIYSDLEAKLPLEPYLYALKSYSTFAYFWIKYWYTVVTPILVLTLIYVIFHRRINRGLKKMVRFLTRPIIPEAKKTKLIFVNLWLFIKNAYSLIFVLWKANKRRLVISLVGLTILSTIIVTSTTLFESKRTSLVLNYVESADLNNNYINSVYANLVVGNYYGLENEPINPNITNFAFEEIFHTINSRTAVLKNIIKTYYYSIETYMNSLNFTVYGNSPLSVIYMGIQQNYTDLMNDLVTEGRLPESKNEVLVSSYFQDYQDLNLNDVLSFNVSSYYQIDTNKTHNQNFTIVGFYNEPSDNLLSNLCEQYSVPRDPINILTSFSSGFPVMLTFTDNYLKNFENVTVYHLNLNIDVQFIYDFKNIDTDLLTTLLEETNKLPEDNPYNFNFLIGSSWYFNSEIPNAFSGISEQIQLTQFIVVFLSIPILYLALFVTFEVNELFSSSFEEEIRIMSSKGVSTGMITFLYSTMKFVEAIAATFLGLGVNLIILPPLLKVDKFVSFKSTITSIELGTAPAAMSITLILLIAIALPRIIQLSKTQREIQKTPKKWVTLMKTIRLPYFLLLAWGGGLIGLGYWLLTSSYFEVIPGLVPVLFTVYIYIIGIGVMISLLGIGLLLREVHKIFMIVVSKFSWMVKKNFFSFSLVEVRSDIKLFNNTFLTYVILVGLLIPFTMTPLLIQDKVKTETYFYGGSDLIVSGWNRYNDSILENLGNYDEIVSFTNITHLIATYRGSEIEFLIINDTEDFLKTVYKPPEYLFRNWDDAIIGLKNNVTMLASNTFNNYLAGGDFQFSFVNDSASEPIVYPFTIETGFDYFPIFYDYGPYGRESPFVPMDVYPEPYPYLDFGIVMSQENFDYIYSLLNIENIILQRLLINIKDNVNQETFANTLSYDLGLEVVSMNKQGDSLIFTRFPFYSVLVAEFIFGILICFASVAFTSLSNPLKILQKRLVKHDILKKIGIPTNRIISLSALELFISCIVPGLILGGAAGYGLLRLFTWLFIGTLSIYSGLPYKIFFPYQIILIIFLAIPVLFYTIFFISMKLNFMKYIPQNLE